MLPIGTVTFLFTDIEGSTRSWTADAHAMGSAVARHYEILDAAVSANGGVRPEEQGEGDSIVGNTRKQNGNTPTSRNWNSDDFSAVACCQTTVACCISDCWCVVPAVLREICVGRL
jgi:class 3 adenylate cyclase